MISRTINASSESFSQCPESIGPYVENLFCDLWWRSSVKCHWVCDQCNQKITYTITMKLSNRGTATPEYHTSYHIIMRHFDSTKNAINKFHNYYHHKTQVAIVLSGWYHIIIIALSLFKFAVETLLVHYYSIPHQNIQSRSAISKSNNIFLSRGGNTHKVCTVPTHNS
jgi:hypothetical protein